VEHRHLLPDEIDLLVDNEEGFGVAPLRAHLESCPSCRAEFESQQRVVVALESLPHASPSPLFTYKVIKNVQMFEPWHVAALDSVRRMIPSSRPGRLVVGATVGLAAMAFSAIIILVATRFEASWFFMSVVGARLKSMLVESASSLGAMAFGEGAASLVKANGTAAVAILASLFVGTLVATAFGLRAVASASRRRRA